MNSYWDGKHVVVTGGAGLIGAELVSLLLDAGALVAVLDDFSRGKTRVEGAAYFEVDAGDEHNCFTVLAAADAVFNLAAAVAGVEFNQAHHALMFWENLRLQAAPLMVAAQLGVPRFLQVSSVCVYAPGHTNPCREMNGQRGKPVMANEGYAWAKRMGERLAVWHAFEGGPHVVIVRPSNTYGPRDYFDGRAHVIPAFIRKCFLDDPIRANGTGREVREFVYAADVAKGMMAALEHGERGRAYNLGTDGNTARTMEVLLATIQDLTGSTAKEVVWAQDFDSGDNERWSDCQLARCDLGWEYDTSLEVGLARTIAWYKEQGKGDG